MEINAKFDYTPIVSELVQQSALLWTLSEFLIPEEKWEAFNYNYAKRKKISLLDFVEAWPDLFEDVQKLKSNLQKEIDEMK